MNKLLLCLSSIVALGLNQAVAQNFIIEGPSTVHYADPGVTESYVEFDVTNNSDEARLVKVKRSILEEPEGTTNWFCWELCFAFFVDESPEGLEMAPNQTLSNFSSHIGPAGVEGDWTIRYCFYDAEDTTFQECIDVSFTTQSPTGISESQAEKILSDAFPNPANNGFTKLIYTPGPTTQNAAIVIHNVLGSEVKRISLNNKSGEITINTSDLDAGIYLYSLYDNNNLISSKRLVVGK